MGTNEPDSPKVEAGAPPAAPPPVELTVEAIGLTADPHTAPEEVRLLIADELRPE
jgi:hypothetical protein